MTQPDIKLTHIARFEVAVDEVDSYSLKNSYGRFDLEALARDGFFKQVVVDHFAGCGLQYSVASYEGEVFARDISPVTKNGFTNFTYGYVLASHLDRIAATFGLPEGTYLTEREQQRLLDAAAKVEALSFDGEEVAQ